MKSLAKSLEAYKDKATTALQAMLVTNTAEQDLVLSYLCKLERIAAADTAIVSLLCEMSTNRSSHSNAMTTSPSSKARSTTRAQSQSQYNLLFQSINPISPEYLYFNAMLSCQDDLFTVNGQHANEVYFNGSELELARLYRIAPSVAVVVESSTSGTSSKSGRNRRVDVEQSRLASMNQSLLDGNVAAPAPRFVKMYTTMTLQEFGDTIRNTANAWNVCTPPAPNRLFCSNPGC